MDNRFFGRPILNSPYEYPSQHWELDADGQPTNQLVANRRRAQSVTPIPKTKSSKRARQVEELEFSDSVGVSTARQRYGDLPSINELRGHVDKWRALRSPSQWHVMPETQRVLEHWRHHRFANIRPFFCQVEAVDTATSRSWMPSSPASETTAREMRLSGRRIGKAWRTRGRE